MHNIRIAFVATLLALASFAAGPAFAQLTVRDATGTPQSLCEVTAPNGWLYPCHTMVGLNAGAPKYLTAETDGSLDVTVKSSPDLTAAQLSAAGLALHTDAASANSILAQIAAGTTGLALHSDATSTNTLLSSLISSIAALGAPLQGGGTVNTVVQGAAPDRGGAIVTGGAAQSFMAQNLTRRGWSLQNQSSSAPLYVNCTTTATQDYHSLLIQPGQLYESSNVHVNSGACSIIGPTTGQTFYAREF